jgi:hypothetical protein
MNKTMVFFFSSRELQTENTSKFVHSMDNSVKNLIATANDQSKKHQTLLKREYQRIGQSFLSLGNSFEMDDSAGKWL